MSLSTAGGDLVAAGLVVVAAVVAGTVAHELSHAAALRAFGVPHEVEWLPGSGSGRSVTGMASALATVTPRCTPEDGSALGIRCGALAPVLLATPGALILVGVVPDPVASGNRLATAAVVGWLACAIPSPGDFAWFLNPARPERERASADRDDRTG